MPGSYIILSSEVEKGGEEDGFGYDVGILLERC